MIHPTAIIGPEVSLPADESEIEIGPYAVLRGKITIAPGNTIHPHACIEGEVILGEGNTIGHGAIIGTLPQDTSFHPSTPSAVHIGSRNTIREYVTIHRSASENGATTIGDDNFLMAGSHYGHDVKLGNRNIVANDALLAGHVEVADNVFIGGGAVFHQFIRIGRNAMIRGNTGFSMDLPPFVTASDINRVASLNIIGLRRAGIGPENRLSLKRAFDLVIRQKAPIREIEKRRADTEWAPEALEFLDAYLNAGKKGVCR